MTAFPGFPQLALQFFKDIEQNNHKTWFDQHKDDYTRYVQQPAQDFVMVLGAMLQEISAGISFDPSLRGSGSIMRVYRDIRFRKDKTPYKTYLGMRFWEGPGRKEAHSSLFIWLDSSGAGMHLGQHHFSNEYLLAYREAVAEDQSGKALEAALAAIQPHAKIGGEQYARVPGSFSQDHPRAELLKYKALYASSERIPPEIVTSPDFLLHCTRYFSNLMPLHHWLVKVGEAAE